jgi:hypothetical protein
MLIETQINSLIDAILSANRNITDREEIEQADAIGYKMWHDIGMLLYNNFISTHLLLVAPVCACSYVLTVSPPQNESLMKGAIQRELRGIEIDERNKYIGAQKLIDFIYENYIAIITQFAGTNASGAPVTIDITLYHNRVKHPMLQSVVSFINSIPHDYFNIGTDLFERVKDFNKDLAKLLYDSSLHFITPSDGTLFISGNPSGPLPYSGAVYS